MTDFQTAWTAEGHQLTASVKGGTLLFTCNAQVTVMTSEGSDATARRAWILSNLGLPQTVPLAQARRTVAHWLSFYGEPELVQVGAELVVSIFASAPWLDAEGKGPPECEKKPASETEKKSHNVH